MSLQTYLTSWPWLESLGLSSLIEGLIIQDLSYEEIYAQVVQSPEYAARFPGMHREDGTRRFSSEAEYVAREAEIRDLLMEADMYDPSTDTPAKYAGFMEGEIDPNELAVRLDTYVKIRDGSQDLKDAFYVYSGLKIDNDMLYQAVVDPTYWQEVVAAYDESVAKSGSDYRAWLERVTEVGLQRVADTLENLRGVDAVSQLQAKRILNADPAAALQVADALYAGSPETMSLEPLLQAFELALLGSAATEAGLSLPSIERLQALRQAGVDRAAAVSTYGTFASRGDALSGFAQRANLGEEFTVDQFERAVLLGTGDDVDLLDRITAFEESRGRRAGGFAIDVTADGRLRQLGRD